MKSSFKNSRLPLTKKSGKTKPVGPKFHNMPSMKNWQKCVSELEYLLCEDDCEDENLSINEQKIKTKQELQKIKHFPFLFFQATNFIAGRKRLLEKRLQKLNAIEEINSDSLNATKRGNSTTGIKPIPVEGKRYDFARKAGIFFFNPHCKYGLNLHKTHLETITKVICETFIPSRGKCYNYRYIYDNLLAGAKMRIDSKI